MTRALAALLALLAIAAPAAAETKRVAVVVGANAGAAERTPLRYAETDAGKLAQVLLELGGVQRDDLLLLQGRDLSEVRAALARARARVAELHRDAETRVVVVFYFSGHSDGVSLEIGRERLPFSELRTWLHDTGAEVRLGIIDACKSGALVAAKGGHPGPAFDIRLADELASTGEALLTSSAADELALESREIRGSFFTHHLVSGLRGAADVSGDGIVTLAEAYRYAYARTVSASAATLAGPQHPAYDFRLAGQGELVLSVLEQPAGAILLPDGFSRFLVVDLLRDQVIAEIPHGAAARVAVTPGRYAVRAFRDGRPYAARFEVAAGDAFLLRADALLPTELAVAGKKGGDVEIVRAASPPPNGPTLVVALGTQVGVADDVGPHGALRLGVRSRGPSGWSVAADLSLGRGPSFTETTAILYGGWRFGLAGARFSGFLGLEVGAGIVSQNLDAGGAGHSAVVVGAPWIGGAVRLSRRVALSIEAHVPLGWLRKDGKDALALLPAGWAGLSITL